MAKVIDPATLDKIYSNAMNFKNQIGEAAEEIRVHINRLTNPDFIDGMRGGPGDAAIEAILAGKTALEEMLVSIEKTGRFIDEKLSQSQSLAKKRQGFDNAQDKNKQASQNMGIKKS